MWRLCPNGWDGGADWKPYEDWPEVVGGGGHIGGAYWLPLVAPEEMGLRPSADELLGGVRRLPTLVSVVEVGVGCVVA
jgi:hypothetical protein